MPVPLASNDQKSGCISFQLPWPKKCSGTILIPLTACDANTGANVALYFDYLD